MLIAHFSDPHILFLHHALRSIPNSQQLLGLINWVLHRRLIHRRQRLVGAVQRLLQIKPAAVVVTGDICQLAYPGDYTAFARMMRPLSEAKIPVIILSGNHDLYSHTSRVSEAFLRIQREMALGCWVAEGVAQVGDMEFFALDAAVPTPSFQCWGSLPEGTFTRLRKMINEREAESKARTTARLRIAFGHFPLTGADGRPLPERIALREAEEAITLLPQLGIRDYLCGHVHKPYSVLLPSGILQHCSGALTAGGCLRIFKAEKIDEAAPVLHEIATHNFD